MADTKISNLSAAAAALITDQIPVNQGGETKRITASQLLALHSVTSNEVSAVSAAVTSVDTRVNTVSNQVSVLSQAVSVLSQSVSVLSQAQSALSQAVSVLSQQVSVNGASLSNLISAHNVLSNRVSVNSGVASVTSNEMSIAAADTASALNALSNSISVLSQQVSVLSQGHSVLSQAHSVLSNIVSNNTSAINVLSNSVSILSQSVSVLSQAQSVLSQSVSVLSQAVSVLSQAVSVISAAVAGPVMRMLSTAAVTVSASTLTNITGMSASVAAGGSYRLDACLIHSLSSPNGFGFGLTFPAFEAAAGTLRGIVSIAAAGGITLVHGAFNQAGSASIVYSAVAGDSAVNYHTFITGYFHSANADGSITLQARTSATGVGGINIQKGSYLQLFRIA